MIQVQRFNKVLKLAVILGDLVILNVLFISFNSIWNELFGERACSGTLPQILTLFSVCYFACTISGGVILHRRGARADQIVFRVLRNVFYFSFLSTGLMVLSELEIYSKRFFIMDIRSINRLLPRPCSICTHALNNCPDMSMTHSSALTIIRWSVL